MTDNTPETQAEIFVIEDNIAIPERVMPNAGPRDSKYPLDQLKQGQGFAIPVESQKQAQQKQSQMSSLARRRGIAVTTRYFSGEEGSMSPFKSVAAPCLGVWHDGPAKPAKPRKKKGEAADQADAQPAAPAAPGTGDNSAQAQAPAAPQAPADDVVHL